MRRDSLNCTPLCKGPRPSVVSKSKKEVALGLTEFEELLMHFRKSVDAMHLAKRCVLDKVRRKELADKAEREAYIAHQAILLNYKSLWGALLAYEEMQGYDVTKGVGG